MQEREKSQTFVEMANAIKECDEKISHLVRFHRELMEQVRAIDAEMMHEYKKKWLLETRLLGVQKCKPVTGPWRPKQSAAEMPSIKDLTPEQAEELFALLSEKGVNG